MRETTLTLTKSPSKTKMSSRKWSTKNSECLYF
jgi:hypothetical protein